MDLHSKLIDATQYLLDDEKFVRPDDASLTPFGVRMERAIETG